MLQITQISIKNYRSIRSDTIDFWKNKTVFVWKNGTGKSNILKAIRVVLWNKNFKINDFFENSKKATIELKIKIRNKTYIINHEYNLSNKNIEVKISKDKYLDSIDIDLIYFPSDRKVDKNDINNCYNKLLNYILKNKENKKIETLSASKNSTLIIKLLELYLSSYTETNTFKIFILDQVENYLHPHATKLIDNLLFQISEKEDSQMFYSTHSPDLVSNFKKWVYELSDIVFVKKENYITSTKQIINQNNRFNKIMISLMFKNASMFFSDAIILVEWETEKISLPNIYENMDDKSKYNLDLKNINIVDVWWKWALWEWYIFASMIFWKENVFAIIDKDNDFELDIEMIEKSIKKVYNPEYIKDYINYNWVILEWEFEYYYDKQIIKKYLQDTIIWRNWWKKELSKLNSRLYTLKDSKKISNSYAKIFSKYFKRYWKPTIAFNLSTYLSKNNWYKKELITLLKYIILTFEKNEK